MMVSQPRQRPIPPGSTGRLYATGNGSHRAAVSLDSNTL